MNKVCKKWKVFLIVLCMIFTMMPATAMADETGDPPIVNVLEDQSGVQPSTDPGTPPEGGANPAEPGTPPEGGANPAEPGTPPEGGANPADPGTPPDDIVTKPSIDVPDVQMLNRTPCVGNLTIEKKVVGNPPKQETFKFIIKPKYGDEFERTIKGNGSINIPLLLGEYTVTEQQTDDYTADITTQDVNLSSDQKNKTVTFTNTYKPTTITITKVIDGDKPDPESLPTFEFKIYKENTHGVYKYWKTLSIKGAGSTEPINADPGDYKIFETDNLEDDYTPVEIKKQFTLSEWETYEAVFTNTYKDPTPPLTGSILITKDIQGDTPPVPADRFTFNIVSEGYMDTVSITGEDSITINNLTPGAYTIAEAEIAHYTASESSITVNVAASDTPKEVVFINIYDAPELQAHIIKSVAEYNGTIPQAASFTDKLELGVLNKQVIYKISITCDKGWDGYVSLYDSYNGNNITNSLQTLDDHGSLTDAAIEIWNYPNRIQLNEECFYTLYYIDKLTVNGTYTNTVSLYESEPEPSRETSLLSYEQELLDSSTAVVVVNYNKPSDPPPPVNNGGGSSGGSSNHRYYDVTYNSNYPVSTGTSGTVPIDSKDYSYNNVVAVKGNTGDLKVGNYTFDGWNTKADGLGTAYQPNNTFNITNDVTLYAQWKLTSIETVQDTGKVDDTSVTTVLPDDGLDDVPKTGTQAPLLPMLLLGLSSIIGIVFLNRKRLMESEVK